MANVWDTIDPKTVVYWWDVADAIYRHFHPGCKLSDNHEKQSTLIRAIFHRMPVGSAARKAFKHLEGSQMTYGHIHEPASRAIRDEHITREQLLGLMVLILG